MTDSAYLEIKLPYGESFLRARLPAANMAAVLRSHPPPALADQRAGVLQALRQPVGSLPLTARLKATDRVLIICSDNTRACPDELLLPLIISEVEQVVPSNQITILVALGLHAPLTQNQLVQKFGPDIVSGYRVVNHDPEHTLHLGVTSFGTPVEPHHLVMESSFRISTGFIEPHFFAGFSGGRKSICPGVSSASAIRHNHGYPMISHPKARAGVLEGNPIHEDMLQHARMAHLDFIVNVLMNSQKQITRVFAGDPFLAHSQACRAELEHVQAIIDRPADITIVTNSGAPLDLDFYQTVKGIDVAAGITRAGGRIIVASACDQGAGPLSFVNLQASASGAAELLQSIQNGQPAGVAWQNQVLARAQMDHTIMLVSSLPDGVVAKMHIQPVSSVESGLEQSLDCLGRESRVVVIPEGPLVLPVLKT
jgi:lactate racemase